jgi:hypothetical protein
LDWLSDLGAEVSAGVPAEAPEEVAPAAGDESALDWLSDLGTEVPAEAPEEAAPAMEDEGAPDWLSGLGAEVPAEAPEETAPAMEDEGTPDWLSRLGDEVSAGVPAEAPEEAAPAAGDEGIPDWMTDLGAEAPEEAAPAAEDEGAPDWLSRLGAEVSAGVPAEAPEETAPAAEDEGAPDWLTDLGAEVSAEVPAEAPEEAAPAMEDEGAPDWLSRLGAEVSAGVPAEAPEEAAPAAGDEGVPDWMTDLGAEAPEEAAPAAEDEGAPDWLSRLGAEAPEEAAPAMEDEGAPDWLSGLDAEAPAEAPEEAAPAAGDEGVPDWMTDLGDEVSAGVPAEAPEEAAPAVPAVSAVEDEGAPDWLTDLGDEVPEETAPAVPAVSAVEDEGAPDWMTDLGAEVPEEAAPAAGDEGVPDWMTGLDAEVPAEAPEEAAPAAPTVPAASAAGDEDAPDRLTGLGTGQLGDAVEEAAPADAGEVPAPEARFATTMLDERSLGIAPPEAAAPAATGELVEEAPTEIAGAEAKGDLDAGIPDWLSDFDTGAPAAPTEAAAPGVPAESPGVPEEGAPDWLAAIDIGAPRAEAVDEAPAVAPDIPEVEGGLPDWLADVEADVPGEVQETPFVEEEPGRPAIAAEERLPAESVEQAVVDVTEGAPAEEADDLDWLQDMGEIPTGPPPAARKGVTAWLTEVRDMPVPEEDVSKEGPDQAPEAMPGWLHAAAEEEVAAEPSIPTEMPDWLREVPADTAPAQVESAPAEPSLPPEDTSMPSWMEDVRVSEQETVSIDDMLGLSGQEEMPAVETPAWVAELRDEEAETPLEELPVETSGPLAGLRGVLNPEPLLAILPKSVYRPLPPVPDSHQAEVRVVAQALEPARQPTLVSRLRGRQVMAGLGRLLMCIVVVVFLLVSPLQGAVVPVDDLPETSSFIHTINALPDGSEVLLVIDYDASLDGELTPQTRAIIRHLLQKNVGIVAVSFTPQGLAIARDLFLEQETAVQGEQYINLGYLPPHPASVQAFMDNPFGGAALWPASSDAPQTPLGQRVRGFDDLDLVVTVSGSQEHVRWWIEQVGSQRPVKIVAGVSASIAPYIQPYYAEKERGQIKGMLIGLASVPHYEQMTTGTDVSPRSWENYIVLANAQILLVAVMVLGAARSLLRRLPGKSPRKESRKPRRRRARVEATDGGDE